MEEGCSDILEYLTSPPSYAHQVIIGRNSMEMTSGYWQEFSNIESHGYREAFRTTKSTSWSLKTYVLNCVCYLVKLKIINIFS